MPFNADQAAQFFGLAGQTALITGGSRGLGLQLAHGLGAMGARPILVARKPDELAAAVAALTEAGVEATALVADLADLDSIPALAEAALEKFGPIDVLVNNAGIAWASPTEKLATADWRRVMTLNLDAAFVLTREIGARSMIPRQAGKILNIASIGGLRANAPALELATIAYNASKAALIHFTRALAVEWGPHGINVNALCPGWFDTRMSRAALARAEQAALAEIPLGRFGGPQDLMAPAIFLLSAGARHVTGQCLAVDGGASV